MLMYLSCGWRHNANTAPPRQCKPPPCPVPGRRNLDWDIVAATKPHHESHYAEDRCNWEFYVVLRGQLAISDPADGSGSRRPDYRELSLRVIRPGSRHAWVNPPGKACEVLVFHFASVPDELDHALGPARSGVVSFKRGDVSTLRQIFARLLPHYRRPLYVSPLIFQSAVCELAAFFISRHDTLNTAPAFDPAAHKVATAVHWYRQNLSRNVGVRQVARAVGVSTGYLRRLFLRVHGRSSKSVLAEVAMERARELLLQPGMSMKEVAVECGFNAFSQFYRAFRKHSGQTPSEWIAGKTYGAGNSLPVGRAGPRRRRAAADMAA